MRMLLAAALLVLLSACGLKDDLYLPEQDAGRQPAPAAAPADEDEQPGKPAPATAD